MDTKEIIREITKRGITLLVSDGTIRYSAPEGAFTPDLRHELAAHKPEILRMYSGSLIPDALSRIADVWDFEIESRGEGDAAWSWIRASDHRQIISAAEEEMDRIGKHGDPDELNAACADWILAWVEAIRAWRETSNHTERVAIVQPGAVQDKENQL